MSTSPFKCSSVQAFEEFFNGVNVEREAYYFQSVSLSCLLFLKAHFSPHYQDMIWMDNLGTMLGCCFYCFNFL